MFTIKRGATEMGTFLNPGKNAFEAADNASRFIYASVMDTPIGTSPNCGVEYEKNLKMLIK